MMILSLVRVLRASILAPLHIICRKQPTAFAANGQVP